MAFRYEVPIADGRVIGFDSENQLTREQGAEIANYLAYQSDQERAQLEQTASGWRGPLGFLQDTALGLASGVAGLGATAGDIATLLGAERGGMELSDAMRDIQESLRGQKTEKTQAQEELFRQEMAQVGDEGFAAEAGTALSYLAQNPMYLLDLATEQIPQLLPIAKAGQGARALAGTAIKGATEKTLSRAGVGGALSAAGAMQGADIGMGTYDRVYEQMLSQGATPEQAAERALTEAQYDAVQAAAVTLATAAVPGATAVERALPGVTTAARTAQGVARRAPRTQAAVKGLTGEALQESAEEGIGQYIQNISAIEAGEVGSPMAGVGEAAALGGALGGVFGLPAGIVTAQRDIRADAQMKADELLKKAQEEAAVQARAESSGQIPLPGFAAGEQYAPQAGPVPVAVEPEVTPAAAPEQMAFDLRQPEPPAPPAPDQWFSQIADPDARIERIQQEKAAVDTDPAYADFSPQEKKAAVASMNRAINNAKKERTAATRQAKEDAEKAAVSAFTTAEEDLFGIRPTQPEPTTERPVQGPEQPVSEVFGGPQRQLPLRMPMNFSEADFFAATEVKRDEMGRPRGVGPTFEQARERLVGLDMSNPQDRQVARREIERLDSMKRPSVWATKLIKDLDARLNAAEDVALERGLEQEVARDQQERYRTERQRAELLEAGQRQQEQRGVETAQAAQKAAEMEAGWKDLARRQYQDVTEEQKRADYRDMEAGQFQRMMDFERDNFELDMQYVEDTLPEQAPVTKAAAADLVNRYTQARAINDNALIRTVDTEANAQLGQENWAKLRRDISQARQTQQRQLARQITGEGRPPVQPDLFAQAAAADRVVAENQRLTEEAASARAEAEAQRRAKEEAERAAEEARRAEEEAQRKAEEEAENAKRAAEEAEAVAGTRVDTGADRGGAKGRREVSPVRVRETPATEDVETQAAGAAPAETVIPAEMPRTAADLQRAVNNLSRANVDRVLETAQSEGFLSDAQVRNIQDRVGANAKARARAVMAVYRSMQDHAYFVANPVVAQNMAAQMQQVEAVTIEQPTDLEELARQVAAEEATGVVEEDMDVPMSDEDIDAMFRRTPFTETKLSTVEQLNAAVGKLINRLKGTVEVEIFQSRTDLPDGLSIPANAQGVYQNGKVYLIADAINEFDAETVIAHEVVGHAGLEQLLGRTGFNNLIGQIKGIRNNKRIQDVLGNIRREYTNHQGEYNLSEEQEAREILAHIAEAKTEYLTDNAIRRVWNNIVRMFRNAMAKLGFIDPAENTLDQLIYEAALHVQGGKNALRGDRMFMRQEYMAAHTMQRAWDKGYRGFDLNEAGQYLRDIAAGRVQAMDRTAENIFDAPLDDSYLDIPAFSRKSAPEAAVNDGFDDIVNRNAPPTISKKNRIREVVETLRGPRRIVDKFRVMFIDTAATYEDKIMQAYSNALKNADGEINPMVSYVQALRSEGLAHMTMREGTLTLDEKTGLWKAERVAGNDSLADAFAEIGKLGSRIGSQNAQNRAHVAFRAQRELEIDKENADLERRAEAARAAGKNKLAVELEDKIIDLYPGQDQAYYDARMAENREAMKLFSTYPEIQAAFDKFTNYKNNLLDSMVSSGFMAKEQAEEFKANIGYVPFNRVIENEEAGDVGGYEINTSGLMRVGTFKRLQGSPREVNNILDNMAKLSIWMTQAAVRNHAAREMARGLREIDGVAAEYTNLEQVAADERKNLISFRENGKMKFLKPVDPLDAYAWRGTEAVNLPGLRFLATGADWLRKGITLSPEFIIGQLQQDTFRVYAFAGLKNPVRGASKVAGSWWRVRQDLRQGSFGAEDLNKYGIMGMYDIKPEHARETTEREFIEGKDLDWKRNPLAWVVRFGERNAEASDLATRKAIFDQVMAETNNDELTAFWRASEIINFNRRGASPLASLMRQLIPFQNAYMQGINVLGKSMVGRGLSQEETRMALRMFWGAATKLALLSALYAALMADDDDYANQPGYVRTRYFTMPLGDGLPGLKLAMPADLAFLTKALPEAAVMASLRDDKDSRKMMVELRDAFLTAFMGPNIAPQTVKPLVEVYTNKSFFSEAPIVGMGEAQKKVEDQWRENTSQLARFMGSTFGMSPLKVDHLLKGYFGTLGTSALTMTDMAYEGLTGSTRTDRELAELPVLKTFFTRTQGTGFKEDFYALREDVRAAVSSLKTRLERGDVEGAQDLMREDRRFLTLQKQVNAIDNTLKQSNARIRKIRASGMSPEEKRRLIDREQETQARLAGQISRMRRFAYE